MQSRKKIFIYLFILSTCINLTLCLLYHNAVQKKEKLVNELCGSITLSCIGACSRLDEGLEKNDRRLILIAGIKINQLTGLLESGTSLELGVKNTFGTGSLSSLSELIIWGNSDLNLEPIGRPNDNKPFTTNEVAIIKTISSSLKKLALFFYDESVNENTYMKVSRSYNTISAINDSLLMLQSSTGNLFNK